MLNPIEKKKKNCNFDLLAMSPYTKSLRSKRSLDRHRAKVLTTIRVHAYVTKKHLSKNRPGSLDTGRTTIHVAYYWWQLVAVWDTIRWRDRRTRNDVPASCWWPSIRPQHPKSVCIWTLWATAVDPTLPTCRSRTEWPAASWCRGRGLLGRPATERVVLGGRCVCRVWRAGRSVRHTTSHTFNTYIHGYGARVFNSCRTTDTARRCVCWARLLRPAWCCRGRGLPTSPQLLRVPLPLRVYDWRDCYDDTPTTTYVAQRAAAAAVRVLGSPVKK